MPSAVQSSDACWLAYSIRRRGLAKIDDTGPHSHPFLTPLLRCVFSPTFAARLGAITLPRISSKVRRMSAQPSGAAPDLLPIESDPLALFQRFFSDAKAREPFDATAIALATCDRHARPSVRMVLLKGVDDDCFVFFTNYGSRKARELDENPVAALCFYWPSLGIQVRVEGSIERESDAASDAYFASRPRGSQLAAWSSQQSAPLRERSVLLSGYDAQVARFGEDPIPRPPFWGGFRLRPAQIEFWSTQPFRMHDRLLYVRTGHGWQTTHLYP